MARGEDARITQLRVLTLALVDRLLAGQSGAVGQRDRDGQGRSWERQSTFLRPDDGDALRDPVVNTPGVSCSEREGHLYARELISCLMCSSPPGRHGVGPPSVPFAVTAAPSTAGSVHGRSAANVSQVDYRKDGRTEA